VAGDSQLSRAARRGQLIRPEVLGAVTEKHSDVLVQRFRREARAAANLRSPHTIQRYDFGVASDGTFYYVMELLNGLDRVG
jgi:eukaryotic-like serine/threonine-protein kinase